MIGHRPSEELLLGYASGSLPEPIALVVASHAALCTATAQDIRRLEGVGGSLLEGIEPAALKADALDRALATLDQAEATPPRPTATAETRALLPSPVWPYIEGDLANIAWRQRGGGIETCELLADGGKRSAFLIRIPGGAAVPKHTHRGLELTLVLQGTYGDATGSFTRGDLQVADPSIDHQPKAKEGEDCICLAALEAPIWFTGPIARLANPFLKV